MKKHDHNPLREKIILKEMIIPAIFAGLSIFVLSIFFDIAKGNAILFASLGSSAVILSEFPDTRGAKLNVVLISYIAAAIIGQTMSTLGNIPLAAGLAVGLTTLLMVLTHTVHPPAGGITLAFVFYSREFVELFNVVLFVFLLLVILKLVLYAYRKELDIKKFHHEFIK